MLFKNNSYKERLDTFRQAKRLLKRYNNLHTDIIKTYLDKGSLLSMKVEIYEILDDLSMRYQNFHANYPERANIFRLTMNKNNPDFWQFLNTEIPYDELVNRIFPIKVLDRRNLLANLKDNIGSIRPILKIFKNLDLNYQEKNKIITSLYNNLCQKPFGVIFAGVIRQVYHNYLNTKGRFDYSTSIKDLENKPNIIVFPEDFSTFQGLFTIIKEIEIMIEYYTHNRKNKYLFIQENEQKQIIWYTGDAEYTRRTPIQRITFSETFSELRIIKPDNYQEEIKLILQIIDIFRDKK